MRYDKGHKEATRRRILEIATRQFREGGVAAVGLAGLMTDAGLTNGAFYGHFGSKEALVREAIEAALEDSQRKIEASVASGAGLSGFVRDYLSPRHRDSPGKGCVAAALAAEVARHPAGTRTVFTTKVAEVLSLIGQHLTAGSPEERRSTAMSVYTLLVGTLQIARAVNDRLLSDEILANGVATVLRLIATAPNHAV